MPAASAQASGRFYERFPLRTHLASRERPSERCSLTCTRCRTNEITMSDLLAYFLTWTTYGTWLPGDERGWVDRRVPGVQPSDQAKQARAQRILRGQPVRLTPQQRRIAYNAIVGTCQAKGWTVFALNVCSNHVHVVLEAPDETPEHVLSGLKAWASRTLNQALSQVRPSRWWTRHGSTRYIKTVASLNKAIEYVNHQ